MTKNQRPEDIARDNIDQKLKQAGWVVQKLKDYNPNASLGVAIKEYPTSTGPADYVLFVDGDAVGIIEAKAEDYGHKITTVEEQSMRYATSDLKYIDTADIAFLYEATGIITRFTNRNDPNPLAREVFNFHRPETLQTWHAEGKNTLRKKLQSIPPLNPDNLPASELDLRDCQERAIVNVEKSFSEARPRALIQMATGAGKTYTAISIMYRLLKYTGKRRILFLVDTINLGEQAEQEMIVFSPHDDNRKFTELYNAQIITSPHVPSGVQVYICTIQRMYSILKGEPLDEALEHESLEESEKYIKEPLPVVYNSAIPPEFFDFIFIDECHRSIYNLWRQVLDYYDAFLIGLTATPDNRTFGFFNQNVVSEYTHEEAVADGVNVGNEVYLIETKITKQGAKLKARELIEHREKLTRKKRWQTQDSDEAYSAKQLDKDIVNPSQIRTVIKSFKDSLPTIFPTRNEVPKTLIFAKNDSHADDIINIVREEFGKGNEFCKKITYKAGQDRVDDEGEITEEGEAAKTVLANFRNSYNPRIAVTVTMIATGTDVKPIECLLFMRDVKSRNFFEQMKGRGTRTLDKEGLQKVTPSAKTAKTHYVIVDAIGVTKSLKTSSSQLDTKKSVSFRDLAMGVMMGQSDTDTVSSLASRLKRLDIALEPEQHATVEKATDGVPLSTLVKQLFTAIDADLVHELACQLEGISIEATPSDASVVKAQKQRVKDASRWLTGELITTLEDIRREAEQKIDHLNLDEVTSTGWETDETQKAENMVNRFKDYIEANKDNITALQILYNQPQRRQALSFAMIKELYEAIKVSRPPLAILPVWQAYSIIDGVTSNKVEDELTALVSLVRRVVGIDDKLTPFESTVRKNFQDWTFAHNRRSKNPFTEMQMAWLRLIRDHVMTSFAISADDFELSPFNQYGGLGEAYDVLSEGLDFDELLHEINIELIA
ncbi:DEAD/DEAH box helicase family protein [uncultured Psychrobacter sp.]|uniref:type I restriction endonuclease subunit R n=1 Tax=uncultured Psychrobacter sp. TaxID=259303 RepID=UPI003457FC14